MKNFYPKYIDYASTGEGSKKKKQYEDMYDSIYNYGDFTWDYQKQYNDVLNRILSKKPFSYDLNGDALYQQYADQYTALGKLAMEDTIGQASAMTGGYGNSYATTAGNQAYQSYLGQLNNMVPQLYQMAMNKYQMEDSQLRNNISMLLDDYNLDYNEWINKYNKLLGEAELARGDYFDNELLHRQNWNNDILLADKMLAAKNDEISNNLKRIEIEKEYGVTLPDEWFEAPVAPDYLTDNPDYLTGDSGAVGNGGAGGITNGTTGNGTSNAEISKWSSTYNNLVSQYGEEDATYKLAQLINEKYGYKNANFINKIGEQLGISDLESVYREVSQPTTTGEWKKVLQDFEQSYGQEGAAVKIAQMINSQYGNSEEGALRADELGGIVKEKYSLITNPPKKVDRNSVSPQQWNSAQWGEEYKFLSGKYGLSGGADKLAEKLLATYGYSAASISKIKQLGQELGIDTNLGTDTLLRYAQDLAFANNSIISEEAKQNEISSLTQELETLTEKVGKTQAAYEVAQMLYDAYGFNVWNMMEGQSIAAHISDEVSSAYSQMVDGENPNAYSNSHMNAIGYHDMGYGSTKDAEDRYGKLQANKAANAGESYYSMARRDVQTFVSEGKSKVEVKKYINELYNEDLISTAERADLLDYLDNAMIGENLVELYRDPGGWFNENIWGPITGLFK